MSLFKCVFPVLFAAAAATASAQPEGRLAPVYDPQGRLIPYDGKPEPRVETPPSASSAKAGPKAGKKKSAQRKAAQAKKPKAKKPKAAASKKSRASAAKRSSVKSR